MTFTLDTSGRVITELSEAFETHYEWNDLSPFTQGYIEALLADALPLFNVATPPKFTTLAPETLARIIADCEAANRAMALFTNSQRDGRWLWVSRQNGNLDRFPPLTVQLGDDGKVRFA